MLLPKDKLVRRLLFEISGTPMRFSAELIGWVQTVYHPVHSQAERSRHMQSGILLKLDRKPYPLKIQLKSPILLPMPRGKPFPTFPQSRDGYILLAPSQHPRSYISKCAVTYTSPISLRDSRTIPYLFMYSRCST